MLWLVVISALVIAGAVISADIQKRRNITLHGAVIRDDTDPGKRVPIADVTIVAITGGLTRQTKSDQTGSFAITLPKGFRSHQLVSLRFDHPDYHPLELDDVISDQLYVAHMVPLNAPPQGTTARSPAQIISNVRVRYVVRSTEAADVGTAVKSFQVINKGDVPCANQLPCSPDKHWKAAIGSLSLDAGEGNQFRNVRVSCIAGPCPFTHVEHKTLSPNERQLTVSVLNWSDTVTYLVEAEVVHPSESDIVRESYPAIFGPSLSFSLPASAEGPSIEAELNGEAMVFPLGPDLGVTWAQCTETTGSDQVASYRCELKPGYRFQ
ncbi:MAG: carboxypeptidase-like regulatory domain-containing protein [Candidatus Korobacteraceae bacterium]